MSKANRGKELKKELNWRGICPICKRTAVKLTHIKLDKNEQKIKVCKRCGK